MPIPPNSNQHRDIEVNESSSCDIHSSMANSAGDIVQPHTISADQGTLLDVNNSSVLIEVNSFDESEKVSEHDWEAYIYDEQDSISSSLESNPCQCEISCRCNNNISNQAFIMQLDGNVTQESDVPEPRLVQPQILSQLEADNAITNQEDPVPGGKRPIGNRSKPVVPEPCWVEETDENGWAL